MVLLTRAARGGGARISVDQDPGSRTTAPGTYQIRHCFASGGPAARKGDAQGNP